MRTLKRYVEDGTHAKGQRCSSCDSDQLIYQEGCLTCKNCGSSKCG
jgi:ribonucleoside-diphosphate reductase alpha chain